ncbi:hypothetical protein AAG570_009136 [Ranatra chinensis]|uniref:HTTM-like domain-containing protein n=1 Tax=Ranatra chinensis TaxID=642074 RepID=A0ABD0YT85_9HEMI
MIGFELHELKSWNKFVKLMFTPKDGSSLAVIRILFGALMLIDIIDERGFSFADIFWGDPDECRFPLFNWLKPLPLEWMCMAYLIMWIGAFGIMLGAHFHESCLAFCIPYWYIFLLEKTRWNNHSYLFGILSIFFFFSDAHQVWSIDRRYGRVNKCQSVPLWNYGLFRFQLFLLYFIAGLKKIDSDWLGGYSMSSLSNHWIFSPMRIFLTPEQVDLWIIHVFGFLLDLTVGFWLLFDSTRTVAMFFLTSFHLMNSQIFDIGMFPFVCLITMPIFCHANWPRKIINKMYSLKEMCGQSIKSKCDFNNTCDKNCTCGAIRSSIKMKHHLTVTFILLHAIIQVFLPYSHFLTKGYNNWTNGIYGYSWDMMVHSWEPLITVVKVADNDNGKEFYIDPRAWIHTTGWNNHADMVVQYAHCINKNVRNIKPELRNISIYIDVIVSLNGRVQQRLFDPRVDLLQVRWSPFEPVTWVLPLLKQFSPFRKTIQELSRDVYSWSNHSEAIFVADFPGFHIKNSLPDTFENVTLNLFEGEVILELENIENISLEAGKSAKIPSQEAFHYVHTVSPTPSLFMYSYIRKTDALSSNESEKQTQILQGIRRHIHGFFKSLELVNQAFLKIFYSVPMLRRVNIIEPLVV